MNNQRFFDIVKVWCIYFFIFITSLSMPWGIARAGNIQIEEEIVPFPVSKAPAETIKQEGTNPSGGDIAILLPTQSHYFGKISDLIYTGIQQGYLQATQDEKQLKRLQLYPTTEQTDQILSQYEAARQAGATLIVGPSSKQALLAILQQGGENAIPLLALTIPDKIEPFMFKSNVYFFPLEPEAEARQIAQLAFEEGKRKALIITTPSATSKRLQATFSQAWESLGGSVVQTHVMQPVANTYSQLKEVLKQTVKAKPESTVDMVFIAAEGERARVIRPLLTPTNKVSLYMTSYGLIKRGEAARIYNKTKLLAMPYMLSAGMLETLPNTLVNVDQERLFMFGMDIGRLIHVLLHYGPLKAGFELEGLSGQIKLNDNKQFLRMLTPVELQKNEFVPWNQNGNNDNIDNGKKDSMGNKARQSF